MTYPGGKNGAGVYQAIINRMPPHETYIEGCLGSGAIMRLKRPARASIGIDVDADVLIAFSGDMIANLVLVCDDILHYLATTQPTPGTLLYLDPPYLRHTRRSSKPIYKHEFTEEQHRKLLEYIKGLDCMVMISGYHSDLYCTMLHGWRTAQFMARTRGGGTAEEWLWMNFPEPLELHDYRYLGDNFRQRERIKRRRTRWKNRLQRMPALERHALMSAIDEIRRPSPQTASVDV